MARRLWISVIFAAAVMGGATGLASAHAGLVSSDPPAEGRLAQPPAAVTLTFDDELAVAGSTFKIYDVENLAVAGVAGEVDLTDPDHKRLTAAHLPALPPGVYTVRWTAISTDGDNAPTTGEVVFVIGDAPLPAQAGAGAATAAPATLPPAPASVQAAAPAEAPTLWLPLAIVAGTLGILALMGFALARQQPPAA